MRAVRCQQVENLIVGAPCGVMDQMAAICGEAGSLMALLCQPAEFQGGVRLPDELGVWGIDSGDSSRGDRRRLCGRARGGLHGIPDPCGPGRTSA